MSDDKRVSVSFGAFSCEIIGYEDPIAVLNRVVGAMSAAAEADPDFGAAAEIDASQRERVADALTSGAVAFDAVESDPEDGGLYVVATPTGDASAVSAAEMAEEAAAADVAPEPGPRRPLRIAMPTDPVAEAPAEQTPEPQETAAEAERADSPDLAAAPEPIRATASFAALSPFRQTPEVKPSPEPEPEPAPTASADTDLDDVAPESMRTSSERAADGVKDALGGMGRIVEITPSARAPELADENPEVAHLAPQAVEPAPEPPVERPSPVKQEISEPTPAPAAVAEPPEVSDEGPAPAPQRDPAEAPTPTAERAPKPRRSLAGLLRRRKPEHDPADDVAEEPLDPAMVDARLNQLAEEPPETEDWDDGPSVPIRFRKVEAIDDALLAGALSPSLFAESVHAASLQDLLEASAVYMSLVEGRVKFSRRDVMVALNQIGMDREYPQQARLKTFRKLLTSGVLVRVDDGMYAISPATRGDYEEKLRA